jgi:hypothetical protein
MKKPWSISTTLRNPARIRDFLKVLKTLQNEKWTRDVQRKFQILLTQKKLYGYNSIQFYNGLSDEHLALMKKEDELSYEKIEAILNSKNYVGGLDSRGRHSFKPIEKMGLVYLDEERKIKISNFGEYFLQEDFDLGEIFFKSFLKWQLPNPNSRDFRERDGYNIKPFIATLHLIKKVNEKWENLGKKASGVSKEEFRIFVSTMINYSDIESTAQKIIDLRKELVDKPNKREFIKNYQKEYMALFLNSADPDLIQNIINNTKEYTDNIIRNFRLTRYICITGKGYRINLEPMRKIEIDTLLLQDNGQIKSFKTRRSYIKYIVDINKPILNWETSNNLKKIINKLVKDILTLQIKSNISGFVKEEIEQLDVNGLKNYIKDLRIYRRNLQEKNLHKDSQSLDSIREYISKLNDINALPNRALMLEKYVALGLHAINDAINIKPNYLVGDDNIPTSVAPRGKADIEFFYKDFDGICEVTMLRNRDQWYNEGQPVMQHLREFESKDRNLKSYCLFVSPKSHKHTINTFWNGVKYEWEGSKQNIVPINIDQFVEILEVLLSFREDNKTLVHQQLLKLYDSILEVDNLNSAVEWADTIPIKIKQWKEGIIA